LSRNLTSLKNKNLFLFDLDGVLYKGKEKITYISGKNAIKKIKASGKRVLILTNNSTEKTENIHMNLVRLGFDIEKEEILTSSMLTALYLKNKFGRVRYFLVGEKGLEDEMSKLGHQRSEETDVDVVVVGLDRFLTYDRLNRATFAAIKCRKIIGTHASRFYMSKDGPALATGPILKALEYSSNIKATVIGKPSTLMFRLALKLAGKKKEDAVMIGDQLDTDIEGARKAGIDSVLVMTGVDKQARGRHVLGVVREADSLLDYL
jgi:4-nitrophenyl phosphatase